MVLSKLLVALSGGAVATTLIGPAEALVPGRGDEGAILMALENATAMLDSQQNHPLLATCEMAGMTGSGDTYSSLPNVDSASACKAKCREDQQCAWYTYTTETRVCSLKSTSGDVNKSAESSDVTGPKNCDTDTRCEIFGKTARAANLSIFPDVDSPSACRSKCKAETRCKWYTYNYQLRQCSLKASSGEINDSDPYDVTGPMGCRLDHSRVTCEIAGLAAKATNVSALSNVASIGACLANCKSEPNCNWYTYNQKTRECFLKNTSGEVYESDDVNDVSGPKQCQPPSLSPCELFGKTAKAEAIQILDNVESTNACRSKCDSEPKCNWYTYNFPTRKCALKPSSGEVNDSDDNDVTGPKICASDFV